jgi:competence protein ComFB
MRYLRNYAEEAVKAHLDKWYPEMDVCQCEICRLDVTAIMLNSIEPNYVVTEQGALYAQMSDFNPQYKADLGTAMGAAIIKVNSRPRHDREAENNKQQD